MSECLSAVYISGRLPAEQDPEATVSTGPEKEPEETYLGKIVHVEADFHVEGRTWFEVRQCGAIAQLQNAAYISCYFMRSTCFQLKLTHDKDGGNFSHLGDAVCGVPGTGGATGDLGSLDRITAPAAVCLFDKLSR